MYKIWLRASMQTLSKISAKWSDYIWVLILDYRLWNGYYRITDNTHIHIYIYTRNIKTILVIRRFDKCISNMIIWSIFISMILMELHSNTAEPLNEKCIRWTFHPIFKIKFNNWLKWLIQKFRRNNHSDTFI